MADDRTTATYDYLVLGAGPAGLQLGFFLKRARRSYLVLEAGDAPGTFFQRFPRHRQLISINKVYTGYDDPEINLRWDWNSLLGEGDAPLFKDYSADYFPEADTMLDYLRDYAAHHGIEVRYGTRVERIENDGLFRLTTGDGKSYQASCLIVATGISRPYVPPIPGIEHAENYCDMSVDPRDFVNQQVLILGKGNSGFETADCLIPTASVVHVASPEPIKMAWRTHYVGHLRAVNNNFLDTYQLKSQNAVLDCTVEGIERCGDKLHVSVSYTHASGEAETLTYDRVLCCTGFRFDTSIFGDGCRPALTINDRFPAQTSAWESTSVPGLYFAGTLMQARDFKKYTSGFIHGFRYNVRALHRILESRFHGSPWPGRTVETTPRALTEAVLARVNRSSGLWQQFSVLCDVVFPSEDGVGARYEEEVPIDYLRDITGPGAEHFTINLEFGKSRADPFSVVRDPNPEKAHESFFLHPVVRHFRGSRLLAEHHVLEDLCGEWKKKEVHRDPLYHFFAQRLEGHLAATAASSAPVLIDHPA